MNQNQIVAVPLPWEAWTTVLAVLGAKQAREEKKGAKGLAYAEHLAEIRTAIHAAPKETRG